MRHLLGKDGREKFKAMLKRGETKPGVVKTPTAMPLAPSEFETKKGQRFFMTKEGGGSPLDNELSGLNIGGGGEAGRKSEGGGERSKN